MWATEQSIETTASPGAIWRVWADVPHWGEWNGDPGRLELSGPFAKGSTITATAPGGGQTTLYIVEAVEPELLVYQVRAWFLVQRTIQRVERLDAERSRVVLRVETRGFLSGKFGRELGPGITAQLAEALARMAARAERA